MSCAAKTLAIVGRVPGHCEATGKDGSVRFAALLTLCVTLSGCAGNAPERFGTAGLSAPSKPSTAQRRQQVMLDVAAIVEGMEGARLSRARRAGL